MFQLVEGHCESYLSKSLPVLLVDKSWKQLGTNYFTEETNQDSS